MKTNNPYTTSRLETMVDNLKTWVVRLVAFILIARFAMLFILPLLKWIVSLTFQLMQAPIDSSFDILEYSRQLFNFFDRSGNFYKEYVEQFVSYITNIGQPGWNFFDLREADLTLFGNIWNLLGEMQAWWFAAICWTQHPPLDACPAGDAVVYLIIKIRITITNYWNIICNINSFYIFKPIHFIHFIYFFHMYTSNKNYLKLFYSIFLEIIIPLHNISLVFFVWILEKFIVTKFKVLWIKSELINSLIFTNPPFFILLLNLLTLNNPFVRTLLVVLFPVILIFYKLQYNTIYLLN